MKIKLVEDFYYDEYEPSELSDEDYQNLGFDFRKFLSETYTNEEIANMWVQEIYPNLSQRDKDMLAQSDLVSENDFIMSCDDCVDWMIDDLIDEGYFVDDLELAHSQFESENEDAISEYLNEPTLEDAHNEWMNDYWRSR